MKARCRFLCDHSVGMALSAIEVYNKPDFKEREQVFAILMVTAWECLLKAKILAESGNQMKALWVRDRDGRRYKRNRSGERMTIGLVESVRQCPVSPVVAENIVRLMEVRDAAIHLTAASPALPSLVYALGSAALRNYARLAREWFNLGLSDYNFFILPVGFAYPFETISLADARKEPTEIARLLDLVAKAQQEGRANDGDYHLVCEIEVSFVSAKKVTEATDFTASVTGDGSGTPVVHRPVRPIDQYPLTFGELWSKVKLEVPDAKRGQVFGIMKDHKMKGDARYTCFNFRSKSEERRGPGKATAVLYNDDAVRFIVQTLGRKS